MKFYWCWRCKAEVPMLEEHEYELVKKIREKEHRIQKPERDRLLKEFRAKWDDKLNRKDLRKEKEALIVSLEKMEKRQKIDKLYKEILGAYDTNISSKCSIYHHARPLYGIQCKNCGKPLRGPSSTYCFECGWKKSNDYIFNFSNKQ